MGIGGINEMKYEYWFANIRGISNQRKYEIRQGINRMETLYYIEETALSKYPYAESEKQAIIESIKNWKLEEEYQKLEKNGICFVTRHQESYPKRLQEIGTAPYVLYVKGQLPKEDILTVAIVGARECSPYGEAMAHKFGEELAKSGIQVVSGIVITLDSRWKMRVPILPMEDAIAVHLTTTIKMQSKLIIVLMAGVSMDVKYFMEQ